jgi:NAD(P)-dependent dehydrogenase (short-subunit alcohol dehydrogenase family)
MGILGEPLDIAEGVVYLASEAAKFVTGTELVMDGSFLAH